MVTNTECVAQLSNSELEHQINETCRELRILDRHSRAYDAAVEDLRDMFTERRTRRLAPHD